MATTIEEPMARPKAGKKAKQSEEHQDRATVIHMKGSPEYVDWLEIFHKKTRIPKVQLFRIAMEDLAKKMGMTDPPEI